MAYNKTTKVKSNPVDRMNEQGWRPPNNGMQYKPSNQEKLYGIGKNLSYSTETETEPIDSSVKKELKKNIDSFPKNFSSARPIKTTGNTYKG